RCDLENLDRALLVVASDAVRLTAARALGPTRIPELVVAPSNQQGSALTGPRGIVALGSGLRDFPARKLERDHLQNECVINRVALRHLQCSLSRGGFGSFPKESFDRILPSLPCVTRSTLSRVASRRPLSTAFCCVR